MEAVGLVVGVAGLFTSVMDAVDRVNDYRSFAADSKSLDAQFNGYRAQLERWGRDLGLNNGRFSANHQAVLDPQSWSAAEQLLRVAHEVLAPNEPSRGKGAGLHDSHPKPTNHAISRPIVPSNSRRSKLGWALGGKAEQTTKVRTFGKIVQQLSELVPAQPSNGIQLVMRRDLSFVDEQASSLNLSEFIAEIREINTQMAAERKAHMKHELTTWLLGHTTSNDRYHDSIHKRLPGTCDWIFDQPEFIHWATKDIESKHALLWIHGHAGFGKTVLCAQIVQQLISNDDRLVAYFFFSSNFSSRDDPYIALRSWVSQLVSNNAVAFDLACDKWNDVTDQAFAPRHIVVQLLHQILLEIPWCTLIIDGLDECTAARQGQGNIERFLHDMREAMADTTRILIVSRDEPEIRQSLQYDGDEDLYQFKITPDHVRCDTTILSQHIVNKKLPNKSEEMRKDLSERLSSRCDGQFIWLLMQEASLRRGSNFMALKRAIDETPTGLDQLYERNWNSILARGERDRQQAFSLLRWAAFSSRPLTICEIAEAILLDESIQEFPINGLPDAIDDDYIDTEILGLCGPLLEVRGQSKDQPAEDRTVHIAHFSVREYLIYQLPCGNLQSNESLRASNERAHNSLLSRLCLLYIQCYSSWDDSKLTGFKKFFREYAASSWHLSMADAEEDEVNLELIDLASDFMTERHPCWSSWRQWFDKQDQDEDAREEAEEAAGQSDPLYYALRLQLNEIAYRLALSQPAFVGDRLNGRSALHLACQQGNSKVITALFKTGATAQIDRRGLWGRSPLYSAVQFGHTDVVNLLIQMGADVNMADNNGWKPLGSAAMEGHLEIVRLLLDAGADLSIADDDGWTPLDLAASNGHLEVVRFFLDKGVDLDVANCNNRPVLALAASNGYLEIVRLLSDRGADVAIADINGRTPLIFAASHNHLNTLHLLLDRLSNNSTQANEEEDFLHQTYESAETLHWSPDLTMKRINTRDNCGRTALFYASRYGWAEVVQAFLSNRWIDPTVSDHYGSTALHAAIINGHRYIVELLLESSRFCLASRDRHGRSMAWWALRSGDPRILHMLIEYAQRDETLLDLEDAPTGVNQIAFSLDLGWCDICTRCIPSGAVYYKCLKCFFDGDFFICDECMENGCVCLDPSHTLIRCQRDA